jgi:hypothetical protein
LATLVRLTGATCTGMACICAAPVCGAAFVHPVKLAAANPTRPNDPAHSILRETLFKPTAESPSTLRKTWDISPEPHPELFINPELQR